MFRIRLFLINRGWSVASLTELVTLDEGERPVLNKFLKEEAILIIVFDINVYSLLQTGKIHTSENMDFQHEGMEKPDLNFLTAEDAENGEGKRALVNLFLSKFVTMQKHCIITGNLQILKSTAPLFL